METYLGCPYHYKLRYHDGIKTNKIFPWSQFGSLLHKTFELSVKEKRLVEDILREQINNYKFGDQYLERIPGILRHFKRVNDNLGPSTTEVRFEIPLEGSETLLTGVIDRIVPMSDKVLGLDYKVGKIQKERSELKNDSQMLFYTYAIHRLLKIPIPKIHMCLFYLLTGQLFEVQFSEEDISNFLETLKLRANEIQSAKPEEAKPKLGKGCYWCEYNGVCLKFLKSPLNRQK